MHVHQVLSLLWAQLSIPLLASQPFSGTLLARDSHKLTNPTHACPHETARAACVGHGPQPQRVDPFTSRQRACTCTDARKLPAEQLGTALLQQRPAAYQPQPLDLHLPSHAHARTAAAGGLLAMSAPGEGQISPQLQNFIAQQSQVAQIQSMIATLTDICWDKCVTSPGTYLSSKEESCLQNCAGRFIDCTQYILQRAQHKAEGSGL